MGRAPHTSHRPTRVRDLKPHGDPSHAEGPPLPAPPWLCLTPRGPDPRSADLAWCSRLSAPAENILQQLGCHTRRNFLADFRVVSHDVSCDRTVSYTPPVLAHPFYIPASRGRTWSAQLRGFRCHITWEDPASERPTSGIASGGRGECHGPMSCSAEAGSGTAPGHLSTSVVSQGTVEPCSLEPSALGPGTAPFDPGTASGRF